MKWAFVCVAMAALLVTAFGVRPVAAQGQSEVRGDAILNHPAGKLAIEMAELLAAGKVDEVVALRNDEDKAESKKGATGGTKENGCLDAGAGPRPRPGWPRPSAPAAS